MSKVHHKAALVQCPRPCVDDVDEAEGGVSHHWMEEASGLECKHCPAIIKWKTKCATCKHELIDHIAADGDDPFACGAEVGQAKHVQNAKWCDCPTFRLKA